MTLTCLQQLADLFQKVNFISSHFFFTNEIYAVTEIIDSYTDQIFIDSVEPPIKYLLSVDQIDIIQTLLHTIFATNSLFS